MIINLFCDGFADAGDAFEIGQPGAGDAAGRAEMVQQRLLAPRADAGDLVERRACRSPWSAARGGCRWRSDAPRRAAAAGNRAPGRAARALNGGRPGRKKRSRPASRSGPLAMPTTATSSMPRSASTALRGAELALAAVDQHEIGPGAALALGIFLQGAGEAAASAPRASSRSRRRGAALGPSARCRMLNLR